jgi:hypothetical protein
LNVMSIALFAATVAAAAIASRRRHGASHDVGTRT